MSTNGDKEASTSTPMDLDPPRSEAGVSSTQEQKPSAVTEDTPTEAANISDAPSDPDPLADSSSDSDAEPAATEGAKSGRISAEDKLVRAVSYKDQGNERIANGDSAGALKHYERGIKIASRLSIDVQAKALLVSLRLNLALACAKEERYAEAAAAASKVLEVDHTNVKALFRRGVARARMGLLEDAKADLMAVIKADPRNGGAKKELKNVRDRLMEHREREKASYRKLFDKGPMYNDKEVERQKREAEAAKRRKEEEEAWAKSNEGRKAQGKEEETLEAWRKAKKEEEDKAKKEKEEKERKANPRPPPPSKPASPSKKASHKNGTGDAEAGDADEMELDEEDLKIIEDTKKQGYCYFKRTLSKQDQSLLDAEQMKLRARVSPPPTVQEKGEEAVGGAEANARSAWNEAGTWEEVDKTEWCKEKLIEALSKVSVTVGKDAASDPEYLLEKLGGFDFGAMGGDDPGSKRSLEAISKLKIALAKLTASITNVEILGGDANVICVSNKIKHIFDFNVKMKFTLSIDESMGLPPVAEGEEAKAEKPSSVKVFKGKLTFPDMTNSDVDNGRFDSEPELSWDKGARWDAMYKDNVHACMLEFKAAILAALGAFFADYKSS